jgi:hypothetical protein
MAVFHRASFVNQEARITFQDPETAARNIEGVPRQSPKSRGFGSTFTRIDT